MMNDLLLAIVIPPLLLLGWVLVQNAWRREFGRPGDDDDVLAGRGDCGNCGRTSTCQRDMGQKNPAEEN